MHRYFTLFPCITYLKIVTHRIKAAAINNTSNIPYTAFDQVWIHHTDCLNEQVFEKILIIKASLKLLRAQTVNSKAIVNYELLLFILTSDHIRVDIMVTEYIRT